MNKKIKDEKTKISLKGRFGLENYFVPLWYVGIVALTFVLSLFTIGFDLTRLSTSDYWGNLAINYCLAIVSLMAAIKDGSDKGKKKDDYKSSLTSLQSAITLVNKRNLTFILPDYLIDKFEKDKEMFIKDTLSSYAIKPELLEKDTAYLKKNRKKLDLSNDQLCILIKIKKGKIKVNKVSTSDLLCAKSADSSTSLGPTYNPGKRQIDLCLPKLVMMLVISALFASVSFDVANQQSTGNAIINLTMRLFTVATSIASGYMNGFTVDKELSIVYSKREDILRVFLQKIDSGEYVPVLNEGAKLVEPVEEIKAIEAPKEEPIQTEDEDEYEILEVTPEEAEKLLKREEVKDEKAI